MKKSTSGRLLGALLVTTGLSLGAPQVGAAVLPSGVMNDVPQATVTDWGFKICFSGAYGVAGTSIASILSGCDGDYLMMAARAVGSSTFDVLATGNFADVTYNTGTSNTPHIANNVAWYFSDNYSWGFAGPDDTLNRSSCDGWDYFNGQALERDRLCWHTATGNLSGGWRAGDNIWLNDSTTWERLLLTSNLVPEPGTLTLMGFGLAALFRRRKRT
jgi:hypothetical protein